MTVFAGYQCSSVGWHIFSDLKIKIFTPSIHKMISTIFFFFFLLHCNAQSSIITVKVSVNENFSKLLDLVFFFIFGVTGS